MACEMSLPVTQSLSCCSGDQAVSQSCGHCLYSGGFSIKSTVHGHRDRHAQGEIGIGQACMGLDGHRARQRWIELGTMCIFLNTATILFNLMQDVGICLLYPVQPISVWYHAHPASCIPNLMPGQHHVYPALCSSSPMHVNLYVPPTLCNYQSHLVPLFGNLSLHRFSIFKGFLYGL